MERKELLDKINFSIVSYGYHLTVVTGGAFPRFAYTIGIDSKLGFELILAGSENINSEDVCIIIAEIYQNLVADGNTERIFICSLGSFKISKVDFSWSKILLLGAHDFYQKDEVKSYQILPYKTNITLDIPDLSKEYNASYEPIWKWLSVNWPYDVPHNSLVITNVESLYGQKVTEATRWEENEWEMFAGSGANIEKKDICIVPLGTMLGIDETLEAVTTLQIGRAIWRDAEELIWREWS